MKLVEARRTPVGVYNCGGELLRDRGSLLARRRAALPRRTGTPRRASPSAPATARASTSRAARALTLPAYLPVRTFPVRVEDGVVKVDTGSGCDERRRRTRGAARRSSSGRASAAGRRSGSRGREAPRRPAAVRVDRALVAAQILAQLLGLLARQRDVGSCPLRSGDLLRRDVARFSEDAGGDREPVEDVVVSSPVTSSTVPRSVTVRGHDLPAAADQEPGDGIAHVASVSQRTQYRFAGESPSQLCPTARTDLTCAV